MVLPLLLVWLQAAGADRAPDRSDSLGFVFAAEAAGGMDASVPRRGSFFGGIKIGLPIEAGAGAPAARRTMTLDLGYDRVSSRHGFSAEVSLMLPVARLPAPRTARANYVRIYFEPGAGLRGGRGIGCYASAKGMLVLFSDERLTRTDAPPSVFVEIQRRFPLSDPLRGDMRLVFGLMTAVCSHCGLD